MQYFEILRERTICYDLENFEPIKITAALLHNRGIDYPLLDTVKDELTTGYEWYNALYRKRTLTPEKRYEEVLCNPDEELEIHNYTGICPKNVLEVSPSGGSCAAGCQYCLVTDGKHVKGIQLYTNYCEKLKNSLERNKDRQIYYYFSPKTEAFSETHLSNGMAHNIMRTFATHFEKNPHSGIRIFIASKGGPAHFGIRHNGENIFDIMAKIGSKIQVNGSVGIMPQYLRDILEPNVASIEERMETLKECRRRGIYAESVLCQPLFLPYLTRKSITEYMQTLSRAGVKNIKPEFFTAEIKNIVLVAQYINHYDPDKIGEFFYPYLQESNLGHIKQRSRLAPDRRVCAEKLALIREIASKYGITVSICNWVKREIGGVAEWVKSIDKESAANGYRCLGYQTRIFS
ncbi:MAG: hypothetical protein LBH72_04455 [Proteiniphilum sp.]|jgi:DNA repair photolyase|nr:hypothetical protein [Proteiniphilum sp.]